MRTAATEPPGGGVWSPPRIFLVVAGAWLLLVGLVGFALDASFPTSPSDVGVGQSFIFGVFETNGWHNLAALLLAIPALLVAIWRPRDARAVALIIGAVNTVVFVAFAVRQSADFLVASNNADQWVHLLTALGGLATGARPSHGWVNDSAPSTTKARSSR